MFFKTVKEGKGGENMYHKITICLILLLVCSSNLVSAAPKIEEILAEIDQITELNTDGTAKVEITQKKAEQGIKQYKSIYYRRDEDDAFLIIMTAPEVEKGNGYLRKDDNFWMYRRNTRTFQHINRDENIAGTDSTGEDFENKKLLEMYRPVVDDSKQEKISAEKLGSLAVYKFAVEAKIEDVSYPKKVYWARKDNYLPLKTQSYSLNGTLMQTSYFLKYTKIKAKYLWVKGLFIDEFEKGNKTVVEIQNISLKEIADHVFTKAYLENLSK